MDKRPIVAASILTILVALTAGYAARTRTPSGDSSTAKNTIDAAPVGRPKEGDAADTISSATTDQDLNVTVSVSSGERQATTKVTLPAQKSSPTITPLPTPIPPDPLPTLDSPLPSSNQITVPGELNLIVNGITAGTFLAWTPRTPKAFAGYKIVRSETDPDPNYPKTTVLESIADASATQWLDKTAAKGATYWYRVCSATTDGSPLACGNVVRYTVKSGR